MAYFIPSPPEMLASIGSRARQRRIGAGLSQADLARRAGVSRDTIVRLERGANVSTEALLRVAAALSAMGEFAGLFPERETRTLDEILASQKPLPQRVRSKGKP